MDPHSRETPELLGIFGLLFQEWGLSGDVAAFVQTARIEDVQELHVDYRCALHLQAGSALRCLHCCVVKGLLTKQYKFMLSSAQP